MSSSSTPYRIISVSIVIGIFISLWPIPVWAALVKPSAQHRNQPTTIAEPTTDDFASLLPIGMQDQLQSMGMVGADGVPEGILFDQGALSGDALTKPAVLVNPISISRIQSAYVPNALDSGRLEIEFAVTNNQNPTLVPQIPETATVTETIDIVAEFDFSADPNTIRNVIIADELTNSTFAEAVPSAETSGSELIINLGDIAPLATVTATLMIDVPATGGQFVELDTGARAFGSLRGMEVNSQASPISLAPDSFAEYFIDTPDADIDDEYMLNALAQIGGDPVAIFEYVQSLGFETYVGSLRGTRGTLWSEAGNSVDQSSLLIAMLRASGVPARYAHGTLFTQEAQILIGSMFPDPVSVVGHIPDGTALSSPTNDPDLIMETIDHWWAQAYVDGAWVDLDPSFAAATPGTTYTTAVEDLAELPDALRHKVTMAAKVEQYNAFPSIVGYDGQSIIRPLEVTFNSVELVGKPVTFNQLVNSNVQGGLIFSVITHDYVPTFVVGENEKSFAGDTYQDIFSNIFGGLTNRVSLALWVEVTNLSPNGSAETYEREVIDLIGPEGRQGGAIGDIISKRSAAEEPYVTPVDTFQIQVAPHTKVPAKATSIAGSGILKNAIEVGDVLDELNQLGDNPTDAQQADFVTANLPLLLEAQNQQLALLGNRYLEVSEEFENPLTKSLLVKSYTEKSKVLFLSRVSVNGEDNKTSFELLNVRQRTIPFPGQAASASTTGNFVSSLVAKSAEFGVMTSFNDGTPLSAMSVIQKSNALGLSPVYIDQSNLSSLERLNISTEAKARINTAVSEGKTVMVPPEMVEIEGVETIGWIEIAPDGYAEPVLENGQRAIVLIGYGTLVSQIANWLYPLGFIGGFIFTFVFWIAALLKFIPLFLKPCKVANEALVLNNPCEAVDKFIIIAALEAALAFTGNMVVLECMTVPNPGFCAGALVGLSIVFSLTQLMVANILANDPPRPASLLSPAQLNEDTFLISASERLTATQLYSSTQLDMSVDIPWASFDELTVNQFEVQEGGGSTTIVLTDPLESFATYAQSNNGLGLGSHSQSTLVDAQFRDGIAIANTSDSEILVGNSEQSFQIGTDTISLANGVAFINYNGPVTIAESSPDNDSVTLSGVSEFFTNEFSAKSITITSGSTAQSLLTIPSNYNDTYSVTVDAPIGWKVDIDSDGVISTTARNGAEPGTYTLLVVSHSDSHPNAYVSNEIAITVLPTSDFEVTIVDDDLTTLPVGEVLEPRATYIGLNGHADNGQAELTDSAYIVEINNKSSQSRTFNLTVSGPPAAWLELSGSDTLSKSISLLPGQTGEVGLYVNPDGSVLPPSSTMHPLVATVTDANNASDVRSYSTSWTMPSLPFPYLESAELIHYAAPNTLADVQLDIYNVGNASASYSISSFVYGDIYFSDIYTSANLPISPETFVASNIQAGAVVSQNLVIDTSGTTVGQRYIIENQTVEGAYSPTNYAVLEIVSAESLVAIQASQAMQDLIDSIDTDALGDLADDLAIVTTITDDIADAIDDLVADLTNPDAKDDLIDVLTDLVNGLDGSDAQEALQQVIDDLTAHTDPADIADDLNNLGDALADLAEEFAVRTRYPFSVSFTPGVSGNLPGAVTTYTLAIDNLSDLTATYGVTQTTPSGTTFTQYSVAPGDSETILIPVSAANLGYTTLSTEIIAYENGEPIPATRIRRTVGFNVVDKFVEVLAVFADPAFVDVGAGSAEITTVIANVANSYRSGIAYTSVISPDGKVVYSGTTPLAIPSGIPATYPLDTLDASLLPQGTYTVAVEIRDETGAIIPDGSGYTFLGVGQRVQGSHSVTPELAPPGTVTATTTITTEVQDSGVTTNSGGTLIAPLVQTVPSGIRNVARARLGTHFDVPFMGVITPTGYTRFESADSGLTYSSGWGARSVSQASVGQTHRSNVAGSSVSFTFDGEWLGLGFVACSICGDAEIEIDGVSQGTLDTYSRYDDTLSRYYDLAAGTHTVTVTVAGTANPNATSSYVYLDYVDLWDGTALADGRFEQNDARVLSTSNWSNGNTGTASGGSYQRFGSSKWFPFTGDSVTAQLFTYNTTGHMEILIDGVSQGIVDVQSTSNGTRTFSFDGLGSGIHVLQLHAWRGTSTVDAFETPAIEPAYQFSTSTGVVRYEETDEAIRYNDAPLRQMPTSFNSGSYSWASRGYAIYSGVISDTYSLTFDGSKVGVGFVTRTSGGLAELFIDGVSQGIVDTYSKYDTTKSLYYDLGSTGTHTVTVVVLDQRNPFASNDNVHLDYFDVYDGTAMADGQFEPTLDDVVDGDQRVWRSTNWSHATTGAATNGNYLRFGSRAWFPFTGDSVNYQTLVYNGAGSVEIEIDGISQGYYDLYSASTTTRTFSFDGLGAGGHVMEVKNFRGNATLDSFSTPGSAPFVDDTPPTGLVRYEDNHPAVLYNGVPYEETATSWSGNSYATASRGHARHSRTLSDTISLTFDGQWVSVGFIEDTNRGLAEIFIDGISQGIVDTYSRSQDTGTVVYDLGTNGTHTLEILVLDQRNPLATDDYVVLDYIDVWDGTAMPDGTFQAELDEDDGTQRVWRSSNWSSASSGSADSGTYLRFGSRVWFPFTGDSVSFNSLVYNGVGTIGIRIDGELQGYYDLYSASTTTRTFSFDGLGAGAHVIEIRNYRGNASVDSFTTPGNAPFVNDLDNQTGIIRYEDNDPALRFNGAEWEDTTTSWSGGDYGHASHGYARYSRTLSDSVSLTFDGSWVSVGLLEQTNAGIVEIVIDGVSQGQYDTYSRFNDTVNYVFDLGAGGTHTVEVIATDQRNANATDDYLIIDYIDVWDGTTIPVGTFNTQLDDYNFDQRIWRSSNWARSTSGTATEGDYLRSGSRMWFPFTGDTVTYQALAYSSAGIVEVRIDGEFKALVDLYNPSTVTRTVSFDGLGAGPHVIEIANSRGTAVVDGFATPGTAPFYVDPAAQTGLVRFEENYDGMRYNGVPFGQTASSWSTDDFSWASRGYARISRTANDSFSFTFDGDWFSLGLLERSNAGLLELFIDGTSQGVIDTYSRYDDTVNYTFDLTASGTHTVEVVVLDQRNPNSSDDWIHIDYVDVWDGTAMPDGEFDALLEPNDGDERIWRSTNWAQSSSATATGGTYLRSGSRIWFPFTGDTVSYQALAYSSAGQVSVRIDGEFVDYFDLYNPATVTRTFSFDGLGAGAHVIEIVAHRGTAVIDTFTTPGEPPFYTDPALQTGVVRHEERDAAMRWNGVSFDQTATSWGTDDFSWASRGYARISRTGGDIFSYTFDGDWVNLGLLERSNAGLAEVFIDGISQGIIDTYSRYDDSVNYVYELGATGTHTIEVVVLDQRNPYASDDWIHIDYVDTWDGTAMGDGLFEAILEPDNSTQRIWRSSNWGNANDANASDGSYLRSGSRMWFPFTGDTVSYQVLAYSSAGQVEIRIDGESQGNFDLYNRTVTPRTFSFEGLGAGAHVIEIIARRGTAGVDAFSTPGGAPFYEPPVQTGIVRYEENHPAILYNGVPFNETATSFADSGYAWGSRGYARWSRTLNDTFSMTFDGSWVNLGFVARTNAGLAEVFIDGVSQGVIDTYATGNSTVNFAYDLGTTGTHTVEIVVLDQRNPSSTEDYIHLDYIDVWDGTAMSGGSFEAQLEPLDGTQRIWRSNNWGHINDGNSENGFYLRDGSSAWFPFTGDSVNYDAYFYNGAGQVELLIDGVSLGVVNLNQTSAETKPYAAADLGNGPHVLQVRAASGRSTLEGFTTPATPVGFAVVGSGTNDLAADIGDPNTYPVELTNYSAYSDTITVTVSSENWPSSVNPSLVTLQPGESVVVSTTVVVPPSAVLGDTDTVTITTISTANGNFVTHNTLNLYAVDVKVQLCIALDGSGSVSGPDFELARQGLSAAFRDPTVVPRDGTVEFSLVQFPLSAQVAEVPPTVIVSDASAEAVAQQIDTFARQGGGTPMGQGINACADLITGSHHFANAPAHVINVATDGQPTDGSATPNARDAAIAAGITQINAEAIGPGASIGFLRDQLVYPQPGYVAPPFVEDAGGFVIPIATFEDFAASIREKLQFVFGIYSLDVLHTVPVTGTNILSTTIVPVATAYVTDTDRTDINWQYTQESNTTETLTFQTVLPDMIAGETRRVADGTVISYTLSAGEVSQLQLPPLYVAAPHLVALSPPTRTISAGATANYTVTLYNLTSESLPLTLDIAGVPENWVSGLQDVVVAADSSLDLPIAISAPVSADLTTYSFAVSVQTPTGGSDQASALLTVVDGFDIDISPAVQTVLAGDTTSYDVVIENPGSVAQTYALTLDGLDAIAQASLPPTVTITAGTSTTLTLPVDGNYQAGSEPFSVTAVNEGGLVNDDAALLEVIGETGVSLDITPPTQFGGPGAATLYTVTVSNDGDFIDTFDLVVDLPTSWTYEWQANGQPTTPLTLTPAVFNEAFLYLLVVPPAGTAAGNYPFTVSTASSINSSATASDSAELVVLGQGVDIDILDITTPVPAGSVVTWDVVVTNSGTVADTFDLSNLGIGGEVGNFSQSSVSLAAGAATTVQLTLDTPDFVLPNTPYALMVSAESQTDSNANDDDITEIFFTGFEAVEVAWQPTLQEINNGESVDYFFTITNTGNIPTEYGLTFSTANGVTLTPEVETITIPAHLAAVVRVTAAADNSATGTYDLLGTATATTTSASDTATLIVTAGNTPPDAVDDTVVIDEDSTITLFVLDNDSDQENDPLTVIAITQPLDGDATLNADNSVTITPTLDFNGVLTLTYTISDGVFSDTANIVVTVNAVNDAPVANDDSATTDEDTAVTIDVLANDSDVDDDTLTITSVSDGNAAISGDQIVYTPTLNFNGIVTFTYTITDGNGAGDSAFVTVTVNPVNDAPVAEDDSTMTDEDVAVTIDVLANDSDVDGNALTINAITQPVTGTVTLISDTLRYTPTLNFNGVVTFSYTVGDGNGGSDDATVTVTVLPVNDAPVALDDSAVTLEDTPVSIDVLANDSDVDGDTLTIDSVSQPSAGTATIDSGAILFSPALNFTGDISFTYTITDGNGLGDSATVTVSVTPVNDGPQAADDNAQTDEDMPVTIDVLANDIDDDGDALVISSVTQPSDATVVINDDQTVTVTPTLNFNGVLTFTYTISDGAASDTATVVVSVNPVNDAPIAVNDSATTDEDVAVTIDVLANDSDVDGDVLSVIQVDGSADGETTINPDNTVTFTPTLNFNGVVSLTYTIDDGNGGTATANIVITVNPVNDNPVAVNDSAMTDEDVAVTIDVLANDSDVDGDTLSIDSATTPANGSVNVTPDFQIDYTPALGFSGVDTFDYTISDGNGGLATATVTVTVNAVASNCDIYPIALHEGTLAGASPGDIIDDITVGAGAGNFGWLTWDGSNSVNALAASLTPPGNDGDYVNPNNPNDHAISIGDWIEGRPGVGNAKKVRDALDSLIGLEIVVPVWSEVTGSGSNSEYLVSGFARVKLVDYRLPSENRITVEYLGMTDCDETVAMEQNDGDMIAVRPSRHSALRVAYAVLPIASPVLRA